MDVRAVHLIELSIPLVRPFRTSFGEERDRRAILVRVEADAADGWGECVASTAPRYSEEWVDGAWVALGQHLVPSMLDGGAIEGPEEVAGRLRWARGHRMAKASLEAAVLDAWLRLRNRGLASYLGTVHDRVECGVSVGIAPSFDELMDEVHGYLERGYRRVKLKI